MAISYTIDTNDGLLRTFWSGEVDDREFVRTYLEILNSQDFPHVERELTDLRGLCAVNLTASAMQTVAAETAKRLNGSTLRTAVFAPTDLAFGLARMYFAYADSEGSETVNVFRSMQKAEAWLAG